MSNDQDKSCKTDACKTGTCPVTFVCDVVKSFHLPKPPFWLMTLLITGFIAGMIPLAAMIKSRQTISNKRAVHVWHDMDHQTKYKAQAPAAIFGDGRAMRPRVDGTVARGELMASDHFYRGYKLISDGGESKAEYFHGLPEETPVTKALLLTGQEQYNIFCAPCHGQDGYGKGPVHVRAMRLGGAGWVPPANIHQLNPGGELLYGEARYTDGQMFDVITNGVRNMAPYGHAITPENRWAIVAYIRALQLSQNARFPADVPSERRGEFGPPKTAAANTDTEPNS